MLRSQFQVSRCSFLFRPMQLRGAADGDNPGLLGNQPSECNLCAPPFLLESRDRRCDPDKLEQNYIGDASKLSRRVLRRKHYSTLSLKGFKTATSKCAKSRSFRVDTVR